VPQTKTYFTAKTPSSPRKIKDFITKIILAFAFLGELGVFAVKTAFVFDYF
jgi:hypothetical protein